MRQILRIPNALLGLLVFGFGLAATAQQQCSVLLAHSRDGVVPKNKVLFLRQVHDVILARESQIRKVLANVNTVQGTNLELDLVKKQLRGEIQIELYNLENTRDLENVAVYAATNVPLYTLISHGIIAKALSKNVWFRTPESTRTIYLELYQIIKQGLPDDYLKGFHLLTESRDVQYDNFNKMYVLGLNKRGTRSDRKPAEIVLFTGNPETANRLLEYNKEKIKAISAEFNWPAFQQVFLGFGAGINPIIITPSVKNNLQQAVDIVLEPTRINNGQDCMAADIIALPSRISKEFLNVLLAKVNTFKAGPLSNPAVNITPLRMRQSFQDLIAFREKYKSFLVNSDAVLNEATQMVSPHIFVMPFSEFSKYELKEHFAPFFVFLKYETFSELQTIAVDERVQQKAMYAVILGDKQATQDMERAIQLFRENRHTVIVNQSLFGDVHPSMPFGGRGSKSSTIARFVYDPHTGLRVLQNHRPKLLSAEAFQYFGAKSISTNPLRPQSYYLESLRELVKNGVREEMTGLLAPMQGQREGGLSFLQQIIQKNGLSVVLEGVKPKPSEILELTYQWGIPPVVTDIEPKRYPKKVPGVVLHPTSIENDLPTYNRARGEVNPHIGYRNLYQYFTYNKFSEYILVRAISPELIGTAEIYGDLLHFNKINDGLEIQRKKTIERLESILANKELLNSASSESLRQDLISNFEYLFAELRRIFPEGVYVKNYGEFGTADLGTQITSFSTSPRAVAEEFYRRFLYVSSLKASTGLKVGSENFKKLMLRNTWEMSTRFATEFFRRPNQLMFQYRMKIAKTSMGHPMEFRVDFIDGQSIMSRPRFSPEYLAPEAEAAANVLNRFFQNAPSEIRLLSGGADIALLEDGNWTFIEFNFGSNSGTFSPHYFMFEYHQMISNLLGRSTDWLANMEAISKGGFAAREKFLRSLNQIRPLFYKSDPIKDLSVFEVAKYFRDQDFQNYLKAPTREKSEALQTQFQLLLKPYIDNESIRILLQTIENKLATSF